VKRAPDLCVVSIGAMDANPLWGERAPVRSGHATTLLLRGDDRVILVDPGLPGPILAARLAERANLAPSAVTHVFLTTFKPDVRRGLDAFERATWWIHEAEREGVGVPMVEGLARAEEAGDEELATMIRREIAILRRFEAAPDALAEKVDLFPLPGVTPGCCGLVIAGPRFTTVIAGDAVPTAEHLSRGRAPAEGADVTRAKESLMEVIEIADIVVPGRDNLTINPTRRPF
jgi:glyoxylase-like metal-dependent hydrolase (beta-lactamase superfamily II)